MIRLILSPSKMKFYVDTIFFFKFKSLYKNLLKSIFYDKGVTIMKKKQSSTYIHPSSNKIIPMKKRNCLYTLSIGMIVKNEERCLRQCLEALAPLRKAISCELIITDTGSTDKTIEIAKEFADKFIQFDWCNDFSAARNTGVQVSEGSWFMVVDADELFDESILDIVTFLKSKDRNNYVAATFTQRNYLSKNNPSHFSDFYATRLFNFSTEKKLFTGLVHEFIFFTGITHQTNSIAHHDGYEPFILTQKHARNAPLLLKEKENNPNDLRTILHLMDNYSYDTAKSLKLAQEGIAMAKKTNQLNAPYLGALYCKSCQYCFRLQKYTLLIELSTEYMEQQKNNTLIKMELFHLLSVLYTQQNNYKLAIENFLAYQESYIDLQKNTDYLHSSLTTYDAYTEKSFIQSHLTLSSLYHRLDDAIEAKNFLLNSKASEYEEASHNRPFLVAYINQANLLKLPTVIIDTYKNSRKNLSEETELSIISTINNQLLSKTESERDEFLELFQELSMDSYVGLNQLRFYDYEVTYCSIEAIDAIKNDNNLYDSLAFSDAFYADLKSRTNTFKFIENCTISQLNLLTNKISAEHDDFSQIILEDLDLSDTDKDTSSIKQLMLNSHLAFLEIRKTSNKTISSKSDFLNLSKLFGFFVNTSYSYMTQMYQTNYLKEENIDTLPDKEAFIFYAHEALIEKNNNNTINYIKLLKKSIHYLIPLKDYILLLIEDLSKGLEEEKNNADEFEILGNQVKQTIREMIKTGNKKDANTILIQYSQINPSDKDLATLLNEIESI